MPRTKTMGDLRRFWSKASVSGGPRACWEWKATLYPSGYGAFGVGSRTDGTRRNVAAHRYAYELKRGPIPEGLCCLHKCDNRKCVNPSHLFLGTKRDNSDDCIRKGRRADFSGTRNGRARLCEDDVRWVKLAKECGLTRRQIARAVGISMDHVYQITSGKCWAWVDPFSEVAA